MTLTAMRSTARYGCCTKTGKATSDQRPAGSHEQKYSYSSLPAARWSLLGASIIFSLFVSAIPSTALAQTTPSSPDKCQAEITSSLSQQQRSYRYVLFGKRKPEEEPRNATQYDDRGKVFLKVKDNTWAADDGELLTDTKMRTASWYYTPERRGLFETKQVLTSELVPALTQSYRALTFRAAAVCAAARVAATNVKDVPTATRGDRAKDLWRIEVAGCETTELPPMPSCAALANTVQMSVATTYCEPIADQMLDREAELLKLAATYDAAYRTLLQFAGNFDQFIGAFRTDLLAPIEQAASVVNQLSRIPCFLAQCNE